VSEDATLAAAAKRFERLALYLGGDLTPMAIGIGQAAKRQAIEVGHAVTGGSGRLSHMGRRGVALSAGYDIGEKGRTVLIKFRPAGAWIIEDTGARPHDEPKRARRTGRGKRKGAMYGSGLAHPVTQVHHPGVHGRQALKLAANRIEKVVGPEADKALQGELKKIFGA
jgi:hypothetical protein